MARIIRLHDEKHWELQRLLPWYVTGRLDPGVLGRVEPASDVPREQTLQFPVLLVVKADDARHLRFLDPVLDLPVQQVLQLLPGVEHAGLHRAHGAVHDLGDLPIAGFVIIGQIDHHAVVGR